MSTNRYKLIFSAQVHATHCEAVKVKSDCLRRAVVDFHIRSNQIIPVPVSPDMVVIHLKGKMNLPLHILG
jgi:hypothetical protein